MKISKWVLSLFAVYSELALGCQIYPLELVQRAFMRGPIVTRINSDVSQWAGRTTLASGSATVTVSTRTVNSDSLVFTALEVALPAGYSTQGRTNIASGVATGTASTTAIYSGDVVQLTWETPNDITSGMALAVNSIVDGVSFSIRTSNALTTVASGGVAMWRIAGKDMEGVKVNTISPGNFFTLGWANKQSRPRDATVLWEIRRGS